MKNILIIAGSLESPSHTRTACNYIKTKLEALGVSVSLIDLSEKNIPYADAKYHKNPLENPDVNIKKMVEKAQEADAIILGTPLYHNSYSGILKNALDVLTINEFYMKPVGLLSNGGGLRSSQALDQLRIVVRGLGGLAIPLQVATCKKDYIIEEGQYQLDSEDIKNRINSFINQLMVFVVANYQKV